MGAPHWRVVKLVPSADTTQLDFYLQSNDPAPNFVVACCDRGVEQEGKDKRRVAEQEKTVWQVMASLRQEII